MFNIDDKSNIFKKWHFLIKTTIYFHLFFKKKIYKMGKGLKLWGIWNIKFHGPNISLGKNVTLISANGYKTHISTYKGKNQEGEIIIGDNVLIMSGVRLNSAKKIIIGKNSMIASCCYLTDADWHDIYDRSKTPGNSSPIILEENVWICDSSIICKGVKIGKNSIIGAGSVVTKNIPPNVIAAGNPAKVVKKLDPAKIYAR